MKKLFYEFLSEFYTNHIKEDWEVLSKLGRIYYFLPWLIRSVIMWILSPLFVIPFLIRQTDTYKEIREKLDKFDFDYSEKINE